MLRTPKVLRIVLVFVVCLLLLGQTLPVFAAPPAETDRSSIANPPGPGIYDDKHTGWTYTGTWYNSPSISAYGSSFRYSAKTGNSTIFSFEGSKFTLSYSVNRTYGNLDVFVDDVKVTTLSQYSTTTKWQQKYTSPTYTNGVHMVRFVHTSGMRLNVDAIQVYGPPDIDPPAAITNLAASPGTLNGSVNLTWSAPAEDASIGTGTVASYLVRYSLNPINDANWGAASAVTSGLPAADVPGASQQMTISGLAPGVTYYFAVRAQDEEPNLGGMSNDPVPTTSMSPAPLGAGKYDDKHANWVLKGTWLNYTFAAAYSGSLRYSSVINNSASFVFTGTNFSLDYAVGLLYGNLDVYVDGIYAATINQKASPSALRTYSLPTPLAAGQHTVQFVHRSGTRVNIDSISITPGVDE